MKSSTFGDQAKSAASLTLFPLKAMTLSEGKHALKITCHGKNQKSTNSLIGIDYLILRKTS